MTATQKRKTRKHLKNKKGGGDELPGQLAKVNQPPTNSDVAPGAVASPVLQQQPEIPPPPPPLPPAPVQPAPAQRNWFSWEWQWKWPFGSNSGGSRRTHRKRASRHKTHRKHNK
jgi:hypothetical protein